MSARFSLGVSDDSASVLRYAILFPLAQKLVELLQALDPSAFGGWAVQIAVQAVVAAAVGAIQRFVRSTGAAPAA